MIPEVTLSVSVFNRCLIRGYSCSLKRLLPVEAALAEASGSWHPSCAKRRADQQNWSTFVHTNDVVRAATADNGQVSSPHDPFSRFHQESRFAL
jgi:hypothetical protein